MKFPDRIDSKFRFVLLAAARAEQLVRGAKPKIEQGLAKPSRIAMREIREDLIDWDYGPKPEVDVEEVTSAEVLES